MSLHLGSARVAGNGNQSTHKRESNGTGGWDVDHGATVYGIAVDAAGNVATGGGIASSQTTRYYNSSGQLQWSANHDAQVNAVAMDAAGNVYTAGVLSPASVSVHKYSPAGVPDANWDIDVNFRTMRTIHCGPDGNIYIAGSYDNSIGINCAMYAPNGDGLWGRNLNPATQINAIAADAAGNVYTGGAQTSALMTTYKSTAAGATVWARNHGASVLCLAVDADGNVYTGGIPYLGTTTRKYDSSGNLLWTASHGGAVYGIAVDPDGNVYTTGEVASGYTTRKYSAGGTLIWSISVATTSYCIALGIDPPVYAPGLPLPLALGIPTATAYHEVSGLALPLALGIPTVSDPPLPPLGDGQSVYRCVLGAGTALIELPIQSFQCRRRRGESTWLVIITPNPSAATLAALVTPGRPVVINAGLRLPDGTETLGEMLKATVIEWEVETTTTDRPLRLTCRVAAVLESLQTRPLEGVISVGSNAGRKTLQTAVINPRLRPGDTVTCPAMTFVAHSVTYEVGTRWAMMTVEAAPNG